MLDLKKQEKGVILVMVLGVVLVAVLLANGVLYLVASQYRFTRHKLSRIQAYYATLAGMNYAMENLRTGNWTAPNNYTLTDTNFPKSINSVLIINVTGNSTNATIKVTANYTYSP